MNPRPRQARRDEDGVALIASLLVMMVCVILVAAGAQLAIHTNQRSGLSRNRSASLHAAEAGIEAALSSLSASSGCPAAGSEVPLPDQNLPSESYKILTPPSCTPGATAAVIAAVGYVPNATHPVATTTLVAHVNRGQGAPVSGQSTTGTSLCAMATQCGYIFPDALFSGGAITALPAATLSAYGTGGTVPNVVANGAISITGSQLDGSVHGWNSVDLTVPAIGGDVTGNGVSITGATVQGGTVGVVSSGTLKLTNSTINGTAKYNSPVTNYTNINSTANASPVSPAPNLGTARLMPTFTDSPSDMNSVLGVSLPATNSCPGAGVGPYYDYTPVISLACTYNPATLNGTAVVVVRSTLGGLLTVNVPPTTTGGQLYVIFTGAGALDSLRIVGSNSTLPVFAFTDGAMTISGGLTGQFVGGSITTAGPGPTTLTFSPPTIPAPDFAFDTTQTAPTPSSLGYAASIDFQYQCPGTTSC